MANFSSYCNPQHCLFHCSGRCPPCLSVICPSFQGPGGQQQEAKWAEIRTRNFIFTRGSILASHPLFAILIMGKWNTNALNQWFPTWRSPVVHKLHFPSTQPAWTTVRADGDCSLCTAGRCQVGNHCFNYSIINILQKNSSNFTRNKHTHKDFKTPKYRKKVEGGKFRKHS